MNVIFQRNTLPNGSQAHYTAQPICDQSQNVLGYEVCATVPGLRIEKVVREASPELLLELLISQINFVKYYLNDHDTYWSFNLDPRILFKRNLVDELVFHTRNLPYRCVLEITENHELPEKKITEAAFGKLKSNDCAIFLDDYGSSYSNLTAIDTYDFDGFKLDKSLLLNIASDATTLANLETLFDLTSNSKLECVVEGVETRQEMELLTHIGYCKFQGYLLGHPVGFNHLFEEFGKLAG